MSHLWAEAGLGSGGSQPLAYQREKRRSRGCHYHKVPAPSLPRSASSPHASPGPTALPPLLPPEIAQTGTLPSEGLETATLASKVAETVY